ncbi:MAG: hypothetical protein R6U39_08895 [Candidatus Aegiribacteria sp.]
MGWILDSLPHLHLDLFMYEPRDSLESRLHYLAGRLDSLTDMETAMELTRALAFQRCSHTGISFWDYSTRRFPLSVIWLEDGLFVTGIDDRYRDIVGSRLLTYGEAPAEEAAAAMAELFPATNEVAPRTSAERFMMLAECMEALGYIDSGRPASFRFLMHTGDTVNLQLDAVDLAYSGMVDIHDVESVELPIWLSSSEHYWFRYLPGRKMLYCAYNACLLRDDYPMQDFVGDLNETLLSEDVSHVVLDLRRNSGGNSLVAVPLIRWLRRLSNEGGVSISLIVGRWTYSSGILNALDIADIPGVTVYGERTGGSPNHLGEVRSAHLPFSGMTVSYPTKYFRRVDGEGSTMLPDIEVPLAPEMLFRGENRVLDAISGG